MRSLQLHHQLGSLRPALAAWGGHDTRSGTPKEAGWPVFASWGPSDFLDFLSGENGAILRWFETRELDDCAYKGACTKRRISFVNLPEELQEALRKRNR